MAARKPEDCDNLLIEALNTGDLEAAVACYEPDASFVVEPGKVVTGHAAIREVLESWLALKPKLTIEANAVQSGDVARVPVGRHQAGADRVLPVLFAPQRGHAPRLAALSEPAEILISD